MPRPATLANRPRQFAIEESDETIGSVVPHPPILVGVKAVQLPLGGWTLPPPGSCILDSQKESKQSDRRNFLKVTFLCWRLCMETRPNVVGLLASAVPVDWLDPLLANTEQETFYALQTGEHLLIGSSLVIRNDFYGVHAGGRRSAGRPGSARNEWRSSPVIAQQWY